MTMPPRHPQKTKRAGKEGTVLGKTPVPQFFRIACLGVPKTNTIPGFEKHAVAQCRVDLQLS